VLADPNGEVKYQINIESTQPTNLQLDFIKKEGVTRVPMTTSEGMKYQCFIPPEVNPMPSSRPSTVSPMELMENLKHMGSTCIYRLTGWWTYEFCHNKHVREFHREKDGSESQIFMLGQYQENTEGTIHNLPNNGKEGSEGMKLMSPVGKIPGQDIPYFSVFYTDGNACDLTSLPRTTEVRYYCAEGKSNVLSDITEPSTCNYVLTVQTPFLCHQSIFRPKQEIVVDIYCFLDENMETVED